jgi:hypothetical protein
MTVGMTPVMTKDAMLTQTTFYARADIVLRDWTVTTEGRVIGVEYRHGMAVTSNPLEFIDSAQQMVLDSAGKFYMLLLLDASPQDTRSMDLLNLMLSRKEQRQMLELTAGQEARLKRLIERNAHHKRLAKNAGGKAR